MCRKQELTQLELEKAEDLLSSRTLQRDQLVRFFFAPFMLVLLVARVYLSCMYVVGHVDVDNCITWLPD